MSEGVVAAVAAATEVCRRDLKARPLLHPRYGGELGESGLEVFGDVQFSQLPPSIHAS